MNICDEDNRKICVDVNVYVVVGIDLEFDVEVDEDIKVFPR